VYGFSSLFVSVPLVVPFLHNGLIFLLTPHSSLLPVSPSCPPHKHCLPTIFKPCAPAFVFWLRCLFAMRFQWSVLTAYFEDAPFCVQSQIRPCMFCIFPFLLPVQGTSPALLSFDAMPLRGWTVLCIPSGVCDYSLHPRLIYTFF